ncbi:MAG: hypothetical protein ACLP3R_18130, partial [Candidatus Korobacteraceae bacterium]
GSVTGNMHASGAFQQGPSAISCDRSKRRRSCSRSDSATVKLERPAVNMSRRQPQPFSLLALRPLPKPLWWNLLKSMRFMERFKK